MCYYVTAVLPPRAAVESLRSVAARFGRDLRPLDGSGLGDCLAPGEQYLLTTVGPCDCNTALGSKTRSPRAAGPARVDEERRLAAKGWSPAKIDRALGQSQAARTRHAALSSAASANDLDRWAGFIVAILGTGLSSISLVLHFYDGPLEARIDVPERETILVAPQQVAELVGDLACLREDTRYDFRTARRRGGK